MNSVHTIPVAQHSLIQRTNLATIVFIDFSFEHGSIWGTSEVRIFICQFVPVILSTLSLALMFVLETAKVTTLLQQLGGMTTIFGSPFFSVIHRGPFDILMAEKPKIGAEVEIKSCKRIQLKFDSRRFFPHSFRG